MSADPWEPPVAPSLLYNTVRATEVVMLGGPDRIYDEDAADLSWRPRRVGFVPPLAVREPLLWDGDDS